MAMHDNMRITRTARTVVACVVVHAILALSSFIGCNASGAVLYCSGDFNGTTATTAAATAGVAELHWNASVDIFPTYAASGDQGDSVTTGRQCDWELLLAKDVQQERPRMVVEILQQRRVGSSTTAGGGGKMATSVPAEWKSVPGLAMAVNRVGKAPVELDMKATEGTKMTVSLERSDSLTIRLQLSATEARAIDESRLHLRVSVEQPRIEPAANATCDGVGGSGSELVLRSNDSCFVARRFGADDNVSSRCSLMQRAVQFRSAEELLQFATAANESADWNKWWSQRNQRRSLLLLDGMALCNESLLLYRQCPENGASRCRWMRVSGSEQLRWSNSSTSSIKNQTNATSGHRVALRHGGTPDGLPVLMAVPDDMAADKLPVLLRLPAATTSGDRQDACLLDRRLLTTASDACNIELAVSGEDPLRSDSGRQSSASGDNTEESGGPKLTRPPKATDASYTVLVLVVIGIVVAMSLPVIVVIVFQALGRFRHNRSNNRALASAASPSKLRRDSLAGKSLISGSELSA